QGLSRSGWRSLSVSWRESQRVRLVALSFLMLFLQLALIRWIGSNVLYLSYFSNFVLLASFLGIGLGFLRANAARDLFGFAPIALTVLVAFVRVFPVEIDRSGTELIFFGALGTRSGLPPFVTLPLLFLGVAAVMALVGEGVARTFRRFSPLEAYRLDILGSLAGIITFSALAFLEAPPFVWGVVVAAALFLLIDRRPALWQAPALAAMLTLLGLESAVPTDSWSPYYKIRLNPHPSGAVTLLVNGIPHQTIDLAQRRLDQVPIYGLPYLHRKAMPASVLIVGAGTGDDVAIALRLGAQHIDAVEIDPRIHDIGVQRNPDRAFQDPRVTAYVNDGRAFLEQTARRYDLILFALPDSLTLVAGQSSLRLESYLFTAEAMQAARRHLTPEGAFGEYNYYREQWLIDRLAGTLQQVYGRRPCVDSLGQSGQFALLFGTTWFVNALVFTGILIAVYLAIEVARRVELGPSWRLYLALLVALGVAWLVQPELLLRLSVVPRFLVAIVIAFAPVFLANLVFARRFRDVAASNLAFAANLLGAMVGGVLEYVSLLTGYRALLILIAAPYAGPLPLQRI